MSPQMSTDDRYGPCLADEINGATREAHSRLNRMIISRLFQALPPNCDDAMKYTQGMMGLASLYYNFEVPLYKFANRGKQIEEKEAREAPTPEQQQQPYLSQHCDNCTASQRCTDCYMNNLKWSAATYETLNIELLLRSPRIFEDIKALLRNQRTASHYNVMEGFSMQLANEQRFSKLHMRLLGSPHLIVAHAWTLYMACHSGGQLVRQVLLSMPVGFWLNDMKLINGPDYHTWLNGEGDVTAPEIPECPDDDIVEHPPTTLSPFPEMTSGTCGSNIFSFWEIRSDEPTKDDFKEGLKKIEHTLTVEQRKEIVEEAQQIFEVFESLIKSLDGTCATDEDQLDDQAASSWFRQATRSQPEDIDRS